jgi:hypothetical protein
LKEETSVHEKYTGAMRKVARCIRGRKMKAKVRKKRIQAFGRI